MADNDSEERTDFEQVDNYSLGNKQIDLRKFLIKVQGGRVYLPAPPRMWIFRSHFPAQEGWAIVTGEPLFDWDNNQVTVRAEILNQNGTVVSSAHKTEKLTGPGSFDKGPSEKAETGAIARALGIFGIGTLQAQELLEAEGSYADSPQEDRRSLPPPRNSGASRPSSTRPPAPRPVPADAPKPDMSPPGPEIVKATFGHCKKCRRIVKANWISKDGKEVVYSLVNKNGDLHTSTCMKGRITGWDGDPSTAHLAPQEPADPIGATK